MNAKVQQKLKGDGKQIADLERAVHKGKEGNPVARAPKTRLKQKDLTEDVVGLLGSREAQEIAWIEAFLDPEAFAARIPISQVTGAVPVNLYRSSEFGFVTCNSSGFAFVGTFAEGWNNVESGNIYKYLRANGSPATSVATMTGATYVGTTSPPSWAVLPAGASAMSLGDVDSDFTDWAGGTEYIMVGCKLSLSCYSTNLGTADEHFIGRVAAVRTLDPDRYPLHGKTLAQLKAEAEDEDSNIQIVEYLVNPNGSFSAIGPLQSEELTELSMTTIPLTRTAYEWLRINGTANTTNTTNTSPFYDIAFFAMNGGAQTFEVRWTGLWQCERYPSHLITRGNPGSLGAWQTLSGVASAAAYSAASYGVRPNQLIAQPTNTRPAPDGYHVQSPWIKEVRARKRVPVQLRMVANHVALSRPRVLETSNGSKTERSLLPKTKQRRQLAGTHTGPFEVAPPAVGKLLGHVGRIVGQPVHPAVAPLAVTAAAADSPGFWSQLAAAGPAALREVLCDKRLAESAVKHGPNAVDGADSDGGFSLSKLFSGAWDVLKTVGPSVLAALI